MKPSSPQQEGKKNPLIVVGVSVALVAIVITCAFLVLNYLKNKKEQVSLTAPQEEFVGQVESSAGLQADCQKSAQNVVAADSLQEAFAEYKSRAEDCKEVYFSIENNSSFRNEGMYPDLLLDLIKLSVEKNKDLAQELLSFGKSLGPWQMYMGPIICESSQVLAAYEESLKNSQTKKCASLAEGQADLMQQLRQNNLDILDSYLPVAQVAFLASTEAGLACPETLKKIKSTITTAIQGSQLVGEAQTEQTNERGLSLLYQSKAQEDRLVLQFKIQNNCLQFESALIPGLPTNE